MSLNKQITQIETKPIKTELGIINFRNAFILTDLKAQLYPISLSLVLDLDPTMASEYNSANKHLTKTAISFIDVAMYAVFTLDMSPFENKKKSSFDMVLDSKYLAEYDSKKEYSHLILSTYDHVIEVVCKEYKIEFLEP